MPKFIDITGQKFNRLTVIARADNRKKHVTWLCKCDCGNETVVEGSALKNGGVKSCGCLSREVKSLRFKTHGKTQTKEFRVWLDMRKRCASKCGKPFLNYNSRGIRVCERWLNSFENFLEDMDPIPSINHSIERINNDGNYCSENCKWIPKKEQNFNQRIRKDNKFGIRNIYMIKQKKRNCYSVNLGNKYIGLASTLEEAKNMRIAAELKYWGKQVTF